MSQIAKGEIQRIVHEAFDEGMEAARVAMTRWVTTGFQLLVFGSRCTRRNICLR